MSVRILIADDHGVMRAGLRAMLEDRPEIEIVGEAADGEEALRLTRNFIPNIILLDIALSDIDGIEVTRRIKAQTPQTQVVILTAYEDEAMILAAIKAGASGYVIKRALEDELVSAIQAVSRGGMYIHPEMTRILVKGITHPPDSNTSVFENLTPREKEVMELIIKGYTNRQIAEDLFISIRTVEGHRASLFGKLGIRNRVELVELAEKNNLVGK